MITEDNYKLYTNARIQAYGNNMFNLEQLLKQKEEEIKNLRAELVETKKELAKWKARIIVS